MTTSATPCSSTVLVMGIARFLMGRQIGSRLYPGPENQAGVGAEAADTNRGTAGGDRAVARIDRQAVWARWRWARPPPMYAEMSKKNPRATKNQPMP